MTTPAQGVCDCAAMPQTETLRRPTVFSVQQEPDPRECALCGEPYVATLITTISDLEPDGAGGMVAEVDVAHAPHDPCPVDGP